MKKRDSSVFRSCSDGIRVPQLPKEYVHVGNRRNTPIIIRSENPEGWCFPGGMHFTNFQFNSQLFTTIHNFSLPFFLSLVKLLNAGICISGIRPASGGVNLPKWTSSRHFRTSHSTLVHHITFYLVNPSVPLNGWVTTRPKKKHSQKKNQFTTFHNYSQLFTFFHNFSPLFASLHNFVAVFVW